MVKNRIRCTVACLTNLLAFSAVLPTFANNVSDKDAFYISKNQNGNRVYYAIQLNQNCLPANNQSVYPYWRLENGKKDKLIPIVETPAYGIAKQQVSGRNVIISLNGFKNNGINKTVTITPINSAKGCQVKAYTTINGEPKEFSHAHIDLVDNKFNGIIVGKTIVRVTIIASDSRTREVIPCSKNCKIGI